MAYRSHSIGSVQDGADSTDKPAGLVDGDVVILFAATDGGIGAVTWPTDFVEDAALAVSGPLREIKGAKKYIASADDEPSAYTADWTTNSTGVVIAVAFSGRGSDLSLTGMPTNHAVSEESPIAIALTGVTASAGADILYFNFLNESANWNASWTGTQTGYTNAEFNSFAGMSHGVGYRNNVSAGDTGMIAGEVTKTDGTAAYVGVVVAIPAAGADDTIPPTVTDGPIASSITDTTFTVGATSNEGGTASLVVTSTAAAQPGDATFDASTFTSSIVATTPFTINYTGATAAALVKAWLQIKDAAGLRTTSSVNVLLSHTGFLRVVMDTLNTTTANRITAVPDLATGDVIDWGNVQGTGTVFVNNDGTHDESGTVTAFSVYVGNTVDGWGAVAVQSVAAPDTTAPTGYSVAFNQSAINLANHAAASFTLLNAEIGASYTYSVSSSGAGAPVTGSGTVTASTQVVNLATLAGLGDGTLTLTVTLTDGSNNTGLPATQQVTKDTVAPVVTPPPAASISFAYGTAGLAQNNSALLAWLATASASGAASVTSSIATLGNPIHTGMHTITFSATDATGNTGQAQAVLNVEEMPDNVAPSLLSAAVVENISGDGFQIRFTPNESVTLRTAIFQTSATAPSVGAVMAGSGAPSWLSAVGTNAGNTEHLVQVSGLAGGPFTAYVALLDAAGNTLLVTIPAITLTVESEPPELLSTPHIEAGETSLLVTFSASKDGQWRLLALPADADEPLDAELFAGAGAQGATPVRDSGLQPLFAGASTPAVLVALSPATSYRLALGLRDGSGNARVVMIDTETDSLAIVPSVTLQVTRIDANTARLTAAANVAIASLQFQLNGARIGPAFVAPPFLFDWNMSALDSNVYQVTALANLGGNQTVQSLPATFFVAQPELSIGEVFFDEDYGIPQATASQAFTDLVGSFGIPTSEPAMRAEWEKEVVRVGVTINNDSDYSPFWRLLSAIVTKPALWLVHLLINGLLPNYFVKYARGAFLDILAWGVNLARKLASKTVGMIRFSRSDASQALTIPAGTIIETVPINERVYRVRTTAAVTLGEGIAFIDAPVEAEESGSQHNLAAGYYSILPQPIAGVIATNVSGWITTPGADSESDDDLRLRIKNQFGTVSGHHVDAVYKAIISENQGISIDRIYIEHDAPRGPGTANAYILFDVGDNPTPYINALNQHIIDNAEHGLGDDFLVLPMPETQHDLTVTGYGLDSLSTAQKAELRDGVEEFIRAAFRETDSYDNVTKVLPQGRFSFSRLGEELHREFPGLASVRFDLVDIVSAIEVPRLDVLQVTIA